MGNKFFEMRPEDLKDNTFKLIGSDWMLVTAGDIQSYNTMTASWGGLGVIWGKNISFCVVRPSRYTYGFIEKAGQYTLSFFDENFRSALNFCGSHSGRDCDKASETGLSPVQGEDGSVYFAEARLVLVCKKLYYQDIEPRHFLDPDIDRNYPNKDYHRMYVGEIIKCLGK